MADGMLQTGVTVGSKTVKVFDKILYTLILHSTLVASFVACVLVMCVLFSSYIIKYTSDAFLFFPSVLHWKKNVLGWCSLVYVVVWGALKF